MKNKDAVLIVIGGTVVLLAATTTGIYLFLTPNTATKATDKSVVPLSTNQSTTTTEQTTSSSTATVLYKDGTYSGSTSYYVPHGTNTLAAKLTIANGTISAVSVTHDYADQESGMYVDSFESALQSAVVGKTADDISISHIGGATLTTQAFKDALTTILNEAQA